MTSREIIVRNLERTGPDRIGLQLGVDRPRDMVKTGVKLPDDGKTWADDRYEYNIDIWGNTWHRIQGMSRKGEVCKPAIEDWSQLKDYQLPDLANPALYEPVGRRFAEDPDRFACAGLPGMPFAICRYLRKMEVYFEDLLLERDAVDELHRRVTDLLVEMVRQYARIGANGIMFCEDWGTQERLLVSPAMWREIYKPLYQRVCGAAHDLGLRILMHSCGYIWDIIDDLAETGVNAFQFDQPALYGLERLAEKLRANGTCLYSPVDIQRTLPTGDRTRIEEEARRMIDLFGRPDGGLIATRYGDLHGIGVKPEWDAWMMDTFEQYAAL